MKPALRAVARVRKSDSHPEAAPECRDPHPGTPTSAEVEKLLKAAGKNRWGHHDAAMILVAFRHGLRASEPHGPALGSDRLLLRHLARPPGQERHPEHPSDPWRRNARAPPATARAGAEVAVCVHVRTRIAVLDVRPSSWNVPASGQARLFAHPRRMPAASRWPTRGTIREPCRPISGIGTSSIRCATPSCRPIGSKISGRAEAGTTDTVPTAVRSSNTIPTVVRSSFR